MSNIVIYYPGSYIAAAPQQNRASLADGTAGTFTTWDTAGVQTSTRPLTAAEIAQLAAIDTTDTATANQATIRQQAAAALATNRTYATLASPTAAQTGAEVKALAQQMNGVIRLLLNQLDATN